MDLLLGSGLWSSAWQHLCNNNMWLLCCLGSESTMSKLSPENPLQGCALEWCPQRYRACWRAYDDPLLV